MLCWAVVVLNWLNAVLGVLQVSVFGMLLFLPYKSKLFFILGLIGDAYDSTCYLPCHPQELVSQ